MTQKKVRNRRTWMALVLGLSLLGTGILASPVFAANTSEKKQEETVTSMDEEGNMQTVESGPKLIENPAGPDKTRKGEPQVVNFRTKNNAVTEFIEQETAKPGYTNGAYGADAVYLGYANGKYKFMLSGVVGWVKEDEVQVVNLSQAKAVSCYEVKDGKLLHHIVQDMTTPGYATSLNNGSAPSYLEPGVTYYSYDGHYFYKDYGVMVTDYRKDQRSQSVNPQEPYYNYFQYLPMRSQSSYTGMEVNKMLDGTLKEGSKMKDTGELFVNNQNTYGVNALLMTGIAANESNWGKSSISQKKNNLFGLNATDKAPGANANQYESVAACIEDFANGWMSKGYLYPKDYRYNGGFLGNKASGLNVKYASDPYWGEKAANIVWRLDHAMGEKDAGKYTLAVKEIVPKEHVSVNVRKEPSASSTLLYKTGKAANYVVLVRNQEAKDGFYEIQSDGVLDEKREGVVKSSGNYSFEQMYGYMSADYLTLISFSKQEDGEAQEPVAPEENQKPEEITLFVTPEAVEVLQGKTQQFTATVKNETGTLPELAWTVVGNQSQNTTVDNNGMLTVGKDETADKIIVRAALAANPEKGADAVAVIAKEQEPDKVPAEPPKEEETPEPPEQEGETVTPEEPDKPEGEVDTPKEPEKPEGEVDTPEEPENQEGEVETPEESEKPEGETETPKEPEKQDSEVTDSEVPKQEAPQKETEQNLAGQEVHQEMNTEPSKSQDKQKQEKQQEKKESVKTGDETPVLLFVITGSVAILFLLYRTVRRKKYNS